MIMAQIVFGASNLAQLLTAVLLNRIAVEMKGPTAQQLSISSIVRILAVMVCLGFACCDIHFPNDDLRFVSYEEMKSRISPELAELCILRDCPPEPYGWKRVDGKSISAPY